MSDRTTDQVRSRRTGRALNAFASIILMAILVVLLNRIADRFYVRADCSLTDFRTISPQLSSVLHSISNRVDIIVLLDPDEPGVDRIENVRTLLESVDLVMSNQWIHTEWIDWVRESEKAERAGRDAGLDRLNVIVLRSADRQLVIPGEDLVSDPQTPDARPLFHGESVLASALVALMEPAQPVIAFIRRSVPEKADDFEGLRHRLTSARYQVRDADIRTNSLPDEVTIGILLEPELLELESVRKELQAFLYRSGRLLLPLDLTAGPGATAFLGPWGMQLLSGRVVDRTGSDQVQAEISPDTEWWKRMRDRPVTLLGARALRAITVGADEASLGIARSEPFLMTGEGAWIERGPDAQSLRFDPSEDTPGPLCVGLRSGGGSSDRGTTVPEERASLAVIGDLDLFRDGVRTVAAESLLLALMDSWSQRDVLLAIPPIEIGSAQLDLDPDGLRKLLMACVVIMPGVLALTGCLVWWRRRSEG